MVYMKNTETGKFIKSITTAEIEWTEYLVEAFDFDKMPTDEEKKTFQDWILGAGAYAPVEFVSQ